MQTKKNIQVKKRSSNYLNRTKVMKGGVNDVNERKSRLSIRVSTHTDRKRAFAVFSKN